MSRPAPTSASERLHALDAIRGVAILGVLLAYTVWSLGNPPASEWSAFDRRVARGMDVFVDDKFLSLFAFLFGLGITQQWRRWTVAGVEPMRLHLRRMGFLLGIGLLHAVFLRNGDILVPYALLGLLLPLFRRVPEWVLAVAAVLLAFVPTVVTWGAPHLGIAWPARPGAIPGGYLRENVAWLRYWYVTNPLLGWPRILSLMLVGMLAGRLHVIERLTGDRFLAKRWLAASLSIAVLARIALDEVATGEHFGAGLPDRLLLDALTQAGIDSLSAAYALGIILLVGHDAAAPRLGPLRAVGRMAFTNYLAQAILTMPLCLALGWFDRISPADGVALAAGIGAVQVPGSVAWLRRHALGPFERLWRATTYGGTAAVAPRRRDPAAT